MKPKSLVILSLLVLLVILACSVSVKKTPETIPATWTPAGVSMPTQAPKATEPAMATVAPTLVSDPTSAITATSPVVTSPKHNIIYIGSDGNLYNWDSATNTSVALTHNADISSFTDIYSRLRISPNSKYLLASFNRQGLVFDLEQHEVIFQDEFIPLGWLPDSNSFLAVPSGEPCAPDQYGAIQTEVFKYSLDGQKASLTVVDLYLQSHTELSADGNWIAGYVAACYSEPGSMFFYSLSDSKLQGYDETYITDAAFSPISNEILLVIGGTTEPSSTLLKTDTYFSSQDQLVEIPNKQIINLRYSHDGKYAAMTLSTLIDEMYHETKTGSVNLIDLNTNLMTPVTQDGFHFLTWYPDELAFIYVDLVDGNLYRYTVSEGATVNLNILTCNSDFCPREAVVY